MVYPNRVVLNINQKYVMPIPYTQQGDTARVLTFNILDKGVPFNLTGKTVRAKIVKPDNTKCYNDLTITNATGGECDLKLTNQVLAVAGKVNCQLEIKEGDELLSTIIFTIDVEPSIDINGAVESTNEFTALLNGIIKLDEWDKYFKETSGQIEQKYTVELNNVKSSLEENTNKNASVYVENLKDISVETVVGRILRACNKAKEKGIKEVYLSAKDYILESTLILPGGIKLIGVGWERNSNTGTRILRNGDFTAIECKGTSIKSLEGEHLQGNEFYKIMFHGSNDDFTSDFFEGECCSLMVFSNCLFRRMNGRQLYLNEVMDSRFINCSFEECMSETVPAVELTGGGDFEFTNQIHFENCRWESYNSTALKISGSNVNEIFFSNCKMESKFSNKPHLIIDKANVVRFDPLQITSVGTIDTIDHVVEINNSIAIIGDILLEHGATSGSNVQQFIKIDNPVGFDLFVYLYNGIEKLIGNNVVEVINNNANNSNIRGRIRNNTNHKKISILGYKIDNLKTNRLHLVKEGLNENFYIDTEESTTSIVAKLIKSTSKGGEVILEVDSNGNIICRKPLHAKNGFYIPSLDVAPWGSDGGIYHDKGSKCYKVFNNNTWREVTLK